MNVEYTKYLHSHTAIHLTDEETIRNHIMISIEGQLLVQSYYRIEQYEYSTINTDYSKLGN